MGNCIETCRNSPEKEMNIPHPNSERMMRIKIVLTRDEVEQLLFQLNSTDGKRQLEDVLVATIRTSREKPAAWRPSLDSIPDYGEMKRESVEFFRFWSYFEDPIKIDN
ncbi:UNVERIFIED_CONTAM: hypothetical protein Sradi_6804300 [Sesamum radiatum]|uniref:Uncharacterized protein n=1 Tax=Sesamum radiatum TaxID=300843 RepID=A0AAW2JSS4_SESRA